LISIFLNNIAHLALKVAGGIAIACMVAVLLCADDPQQPRKVNIGPAAAAEVTTLSLPQTGVSQASIQATDLYLPSGYRKSDVGKAVASVSSLRQYSASQLIGSDGTNPSGADVLPLGSRILARLDDQLHSTETMTPAIATILDDGADPNGSVVVPAGTKAFGQASFDNSTQRMQIRFHTLVFADGHQSPISAIALFSDGSAGLVGSYHSSSGMQQAGRFISQFISGLAGGMREKQVTVGGQAFDKGTFKNGLLTGTADAASDQSRRIGQEMEGTKPYLEVPGGTEFQLFLDKEFAL
jgi:hypothetical protein